MSVARSQLAAVLTDALLNNSDGFRWNADDLKISRHGGCGFAIDCRKVVVNSDVDFVGFLVVVTNTVF